MIYEEEYDSKGNPLEIHESIDKYIEEHRDELKGLDYNQVVDRYRPGAHKLDKENIARFLQRGVVHKPMQIIENLLYQMTQSSKVNKEKIKEMNVALRILKMMSENGGNNGGKVTKT
jgi:ABC-type transporter Mla maintaining outer membrane lipid asymmetry ATPase subunit MlaF